MPLLLLTPLSGEALGGPSRAMIFYNCMLSPCLAASLASLANPAIQLVRSAANEAHACPLPARSPKAFMCGMLSGASSSDLPEADLNAFLVATVRSCGYIQGHLFPLHLLGAVVHGWHVVVWIAPVVSAP